MYSRKICNAVLDDFERREGWRPVEHTVGQIEEFNNYIGSIIEIEKTERSQYITFKAGLRMTERRKEEIRRWIVNEQYLCFADSGYFESRYAYICNEAGDIFKFSNRKSQEIFDKILDPFDEQQVAIELFYLKGRQIGVSTKVVLKFVHRLLFIPHTQGVMASVNNQTSELLARMMSTCWQRLPFWLPPAQTSTKSSAPEWANGSIMSIQSGSQAMGIAQGWTPTLIHICLTPNTLVRVGNGFLKPISEVVAGDMAITKEGILAPVRASIKSERKNEISREIWMWGNFAPLGCTLDHPVFTNEGWKKAETLNVGDWVRHPVRPIARTVERFRRIRLQPGKKTSKDRPYVNLNPEWGYLCGLYLAEGSVQHNKKLRKENSHATSILFSVHRKEVDSVIERIKAATHKEQHCGVGLREGSDSAVIRLHVSWLARWMADEFGACDQKRVPDWVWNAGRDFCLQLVKGYLDGDGHYGEGKNEIYASSIRVQLPIQMRDLIASLGFGWAAIQYKEAGVYYERNCRAQWTLILNGECGRSLREHFGLASYPCTEARHWKYDLLKENVDIEIETVADGFSKEFYDLEIDHPSHSFVTAQCAVHNSEVADIPRPKKVLEEGLFPACHSTRKLFFVMEGTGSDSVSWQAQKWRYYKANWGKGGRFMPVFIPWECATDLYPQPDWLRKNPIPPNWVPQDETKRMARKAELYIRSTGYLSRIMGTNYCMPREQQWFWETRYCEAASTNTLKVFLSQYPVSDDEALQSKHDRVFSDDMIEVVSGERERNYQAYAITGASVLIGQNDEPYEPDPGIIDYSKERIQVSWKAKNGQISEWELVPIREFDDTEDQASFNKVLIFQHPRPGANYSIGVDTADGLGYPDEERSCCSVSLNRQGNQRDEQVAEFVSNAVNPPQMVSIAACLGAYYGQWRGDTPGTGDPRGVKFIIEQRERYGDDCQFQLKLLGFTYHHKFIYYDSIKVDKNAAAKHGWFSNAWSVPMLVNRFVDAINNGWYKPNSPMLIRQLSTWVRKTASSGKTKLDHESGKFDDCIRAAAQAYFTAHSHDVLVQRQQVKYQTQDEKQPPIDLGWCSNQITV